ncbi:DEAD/DEAH box helicase [Paraglaciecola chathamensis]|uniref:ATP-dependent DNA helicase RecG n=1 Tax=Paraglaciecola chathamensis TaxID=368405 RepID=A0A8H9LYN2_9ALTE|nr:DEAD/DEAH box helicase [Paraglaciecola oceanifecundans]GGZ83094.1 ATP-dependent DNA helicase RecG [Paraglaciecola oceanifecundans]
MPFKPGRLKQLGIEELKDVALFLPSGVQDYRVIKTLFDPRDIIPNSQLTLAGVVKSEPEVRWSNKRPRTVFTISDGANTARFSLFGDVRDTVKLYPVNAPLVVKGSATFYGGRLFLDDAQIVPKEFTGKVVPVYKGKSGKITALTTFKLVQSHLTQSIDAANQHLTEMLGRLPIQRPEIESILGIKIADIPQLLNHAHKPFDVEVFEKAMERLRVLSTLIVCQYLMAPKQKAVRTMPFLSTGYLQLVQNIPFELTKEQKRIIGHVIKQVRAGELVDALLVGDVGSGKTIVYGLIAAYFAWAGKPAAVLLPNVNLARQIHSEFVEFFPWMSVALVTGGTDTARDAEANVLIGTTSLLNKALPRLDLLIIDEQQKLGHSQREALRATDTHCIEVSATPIPRSFALAIYGHRDILTLKGCHVEKQIVTKIRDADQRRPMFEEMMDDIRRGDKVLVICPQREINPESKIKLKSAEEIANKFQAYCPGQVALAHAGLSDEENRDAIESFRSGIKPILVSTVMVEVGMTIPSLQRVIICHPDRFGLTQLHQIRGRVARQGGVGYCDLFCPDLITNPKTRERLEVLCKTQDGFAIAEHDLRLRGMGDIMNGNSQHGDTELPFKNITISIDDLDKFISKLNQESTQHAS